jgi:Flp pilus assembly protein protease CpaA
MFPELYFQVPVFFLLLVAARQDYLTRTVSNDVIIYISVFSLPLIFVQTNWMIPILLCLLFLILFYISDLKILKGTFFEDSIGGADTKVFIPLLLQMTTNDIFIFFFLFSVSNIILIFRFWKGIPLFISILFGYFGVLLLSFLPIIIRIVFGY